MANTTAILAILRTRSDRSHRYTGLLTFEAESVAGPESARLRFVPAFFDANLGGRIRALQRELTQIRSEYQAHLTNPNSSEAKRIQERLRKVGSSLFNRFECEGIFDELFQTQSIRNLVVYTNEPAIPWQWVFDADSGLFACERFAMGKVFMQDVRRGSPALGDFLRRDDPEELEHSVLELLKRRSALIFEGSWPGHASELPQATREAQLLESSFKARFGQAKRVRGDDVEFSDAMRLMADRLKVIHYSGHSSIKGLTPKPGTVLAAEQISGSPRSLKSNPIVFLNSCDSGTIRKVWEREANVATAFLSRGACGCVVTSFPVEDRAAEEFAIRFYDEALGSEHAPAIGEILRLIRVNQGHDAEFVNDISRLAFDYYGDPRGRLKASQIHRIRTQQTDTYEGKRIYQRFKKQL